MSGGFHLSYIPLLHFCELLFCEYFLGYGEVNVRVCIDGWHKQVMLLYPSVVWEPSPESLLLGVGHQQVMQ